MASRLELHEKLCELLGTRNVYFQPPSTHKMSYPCTRYELSNVDSRFANNMPYNHEKSYTLTVIDKDPDSKIPDSILALQKCKFDRSYTADNLNHWVFTLYF